MNRSYTVTRLGKIGYWLNPTVLIIVAVFRVINFINTAGSMQSHLTFEISSMFAMLIFFSVLLYFSCYKSYIEIAISDDSIIFKNPFHKLEIPSENITSIQVLKSPLSFSTIYIHHRDGMVLLLFPFTNITEFFDIIAMKNTRVSIKR